MKKLIILLFSVTIVGAVVVFVIYNNKNHDNNLIKIGYKLNSGYQNFFVAKDKGIFDKYNLKVKGVSFTSTNQMMQALVSGQIDATAAGSIEVIAETEIKSPNSIRIYNTLVFDKDNSYFSIIVPINSEIKSINDLKGKKIGVLPGTTSVVFLNASVSSFFSPDSISIEQLELRIQLQALILKQVDALYTVDPIITLAISKNIGKVLIKGPENIYIMNPLAIGGAVVSNEFFTKRKKIALLLIAAMNEAVDFMRVNIEETRQIVAKNTNLEINVANNLSLINYWKLEETNYTEVQNYLDFLFTKKIITKPIRAKNLYLEN